MRTIPDPKDPAVVKWLDGIQPAWTMLDWDSFLALHFPPSTDHGPIRLAADLTQDELQQSAHGTLSSCCVTLPQAQD